MCFLSSLLRMDKLHQISGVIRVTTDIDVAKLAENVEDLNRNVENLGKTIDALSAKCENFERDSYKT